MGVCKNCPRSGCGSYHDKCEKYQAEKKKIETYNEVKRKPYSVVRK